MKKAKKSMKKAKESMKKEGEVEAMKVSVIGRGRPRRGRPRKAQDLYSGKAIQKVANTMEDGIIKDKKEPIWNATGVVTEKATKSMKKATKSMKKANKSMKKATKSMKKEGEVEAMKVSVIARGRLRKAQVWKKSMEKTAWGLKKKDMIKNKAGKIVSKKLSTRASKTKLPEALMKARKALGIVGFCPNGGKTQRGQELLKKFREFYGQ